MPRETRCRRVSNEPKVNLFVPQGIPSQDLHEVILKVEELEALRLKDMLHLEQEACAQHMDVSRPTFQRVLNEARYNIVWALTNGNAIRIEGGNYCLGNGFCRRYGRSLMKNEICAMQQEGLSNNNMKESAIRSKKIAICATGTSPSSLIDERFGRCAFFIIWDPDTKQYDALSNTGTEAAHGAGTGATQALIQHNVGIVISQRLGPKAFVALEVAGIKVFSSVTGKTVESALQSYQAGELQELASPND